MVRPPSCSFRRLWPWTSHLDQVPVSPAPSKIQISLPRQPVWRASPDGLSTRKYSLPSSCEQTTWSLFFSDVQRLAIWSDCVLWLML